jgi:clan AA aspartic protease
MIEGIVESNEAKIRVKVRGPDGREDDFDAVVDTGYTSSLTLPAAQIAKLGLDWKGFDRCILGDGSECLFDIYAGEVQWDGQWKNVTIDEAASDPLVGMELMNGFEIIIQVRNGGQVTIKKL